MRETVCIVGNIVTVAVKIHCVKWCPPHGAVRNGVAAATSLSPPQQATVIPSLCYRSPSGYTVRRGSFHTNDTMQLRHSSNTTPLFTRLY